MMALAQAMHESSGDFPPEIGEPWDPWQIHVERLDGPMQDGLSLSLGLSDVYDNLKEGFRLLDAGRPEAEAVFLWRLNFWGHWGYHNAKALKLLQSGKVWVKISGAYRSSNAAPVVFATTRASVSTVSGSRLNKSNASMKLVPMMGSPPMPMAVDCPMPRCVS